MWRGRKRKRKRKRKRELRVFVSTEESTVPPNVLKIIFLDVKILKFFFKNLAFQSQFYVKLRN
jgi:hypothetical protein